MSQLSDGTVTGHFNNKFFTSKIAHFEEFSKRQISKVSHSRSVSFSECLIFEVSLFRSLFFQVSHFRDVSFLECLILEVSHFPSVSFSGCLIFEVSHSLFLNPSGNLRPIWTFLLFYFEKNEKVLVGKIFSLSHINSSNFTLFSMKRVSRFYLICVGDFLRVFNWHLERRFPDGLILRSNFQNLGV